MASFGSLEESEYARLPFLEAQAALSVTAPAGRGVTATVGWHGTRLDPERGSFAVVRSGGPLDGYIGERIRVTYLTSGGGRSVVALVHSRSEGVLDDLSLTRRAYLALASLNLVPLTVTVEVLS